MFNENDEFHSLQCGDGPQARERELFEVVKKLTCEILQCSRADLERAHVFSDQEQIWFESDAGHGQLRVAIKKMVRARAYTCTKIAVQPPVDEGPPAVPFPVPGNIYVQDDPLGLSTHDGTENEEQLGDASCLWCSNWDVVSRRIIPAFEQNRGSCLRLVEFAIDAIREATQKLSQSSTQ